MAEDDANWKRAEQSEEEVEDFGQVGRREERVGR
jgi:hypothetical protein